MMARIVQVLTLVAASATFAQSQPSKQPPRQTVTERSVDDAAQSEPTINITVAAPETPAEQKQAEADRARREDETNERIADANMEVARFTFLLAIVAILQFVATVAGFSIASKAAKAAKRSAAAAEASADTARTGLQVAQRAYVYFTGGGLVGFGSSQSPRLRFTLKNTGVLPARLLESAYKVIVSDADGPDDPAPADLRWIPRPGIIPRDILSNHEVPFADSDGNSASISSDELAQIRAGRLRVRVYLSVRYLDGFQVQRESRAAIDYAPDIKGWLIAKTERWNYAD